MKSVLAIAIALTIAAPISAKSPDRPYRPAGQIAVLNMPFNDAQACVAREMDKGGSVLILPTTGGSDIDFTLSGGLFAQATGEPYATFRLREISSNEVTLSAVYRRPLSAKSIINMMKALGRKCLVVKEMRLETPGPPPRS